MPIQGTDSTRSQNLDTSGDERRNEPRLPAAGEVVLALAGPVPRMISGQLLDTSRSGFRASHSSPLLETGSRVQFRFEQASGVARVCWNRSSGGRWETGFLILPK
jgi:PilZ domain